MEFILQLIATPAVLLAASRTLKGIYVKDFKAAFWTSLWIILAGFLIGWLFTFILNVATLGLFWAVGLGVVTRTIAYAIIIEMIDQLRDDFKTKGFLPSLWLSILLAITWGIIDMIA